MAARLKAIAFEVFKREHWPGELSANCANYTDGGSCHDQGIEPCTSCATYGRLVEEFEVIGVG